jgi:hypothetical protein
MRFKRQSYPGDKKEGKMIDVIFDGMFDFVYLILKRRKQKSQEWRGVLEEKRLKSGYSQARKKYSLYFRTESGKRKRIRVEEKDFPIYEKGKNYQKNRGELLPHPASAI